MVFAKNITGTVDKWRTWIEPDRAVRKEVLVSRLSKGHLWSAVVTFPWEAISHVSYAAYNYHTKASLPADIFLIHEIAVVLLLVQRLSVISYVWFLPWTTSPSTTNTTYRYTVQPWKPEWHLLIPTCSSPNLRQTLCHVLHINHTHGGVT